MPMNGKFPLIGALLSTRQRVKELVLYRLLPDWYFLKRAYRYKLGRNLSLKNPMLWTEKIQWLKLNDRSALHTECADKLQVRAYVQNKIGDEYLVKHYFETDRVEEITAKNLPEIPVIIKTNHDSSGGIIVRTKSTVDFQEIQRTLRQRMRQSHYHATKEWQYRNIQPRILVEKLLMDDKGRIPDDYKVHCFNGKPELIQVNIDRFGEKENKRSGDDYSRCFYSTRWDKLDLDWGDHPSIGEVPCPSELSKLLKLSELLAEPFCYARIDFYVNESKVFFGEITFHPASGYVKLSEFWDNKLGQMLQLPVNVGRQ